MTFIKNYNPNNPGVVNGQFMGLPFKEEDAHCVLLPVPWDVTTSFAEGTATAPMNILASSYQLDIGDHAFPETWKKGIFMVPSNPEILKWNEKWRNKATQIITAWEEGEQIEESDEWRIRLDDINRASEKLNTKVYNMSKKYLELHKKVLLIGGDHSTPYGYIKALEAYHEGFGVLQIDAHCDLRKAYEGFTYSHASIMYNVMNDCPSVTNLVQVGIRDWCPEEEQRINDSYGWVKTHFMHDMVQRIFEGESWGDQCERIVADLPERIYISLDIDGLDPANCPNTGTPVPGGLDYQQVIYLLEQIHDSGREIIGADLCEVAGAGNDWDGNVGARLAYKLALLLLD
ncbi:agmatinase family protein [Membranicola marinus]|uniref:Agmatinase family protein n=1 Tax=Membranihabitans marinus TaxID=1227546 RepID=A0A953HNL4_9BACT|nr:agmatinase family protein [Membranihabitans marinus]MBY5958414.1 agmatinase family protein [Membranihabitans marinus]